MANATIPMNDVDRPVIRDVIAAANVGDLIIGDTIPTTNARGSVAGDTT